MSLRDIGAYHCYNHASYSRIAKEMNLKVNKCTAMDWDEFGGSERSDGESLSDGSGAGTDADAAALGMDTQPAEFYDAEADDRDEAWVQKMRRSHNSDAILSCPLCFTTLCIDCQQHAKFENQFRAVFVMNCRLKTGEAVAMPPAPSNKKQRRQQRQRQQQEEQQRQQVSGQQSAPTAPGTERQQPGAAALLGEQQQSELQAQQLEPPPADAATGAVAAGAAADASGCAAATAAGGERLNPVCCGVCDTEVGLRDPGEGVYFFFNVFASNS
ncbi:E2F-associated phospho [Micractinium conductrix]|uniref:E2F-associated phospho n=1 Tax=Micractinium conductrix TaxID=554055 RepID=A0A2P6VEI3_9CHLO|nr:E2F-associated phospho [Micractinium conductrix]|eukprot:PSC72503.1 E2F-associated phospho [Micractinium conductrix]